MKSPGLRDRVRAFARAARFRSPECRKRRQVRERARQRRRRREPVRAARARRGGRYSSAMAMCVGLVTTNAASLTLRNDPREIWRCNARRRPRASGSPSLLFLVALEFVERHAQSLAPAHELQAVIGACEDAADDAGDGRRAHCAVPCRRCHAAETAARGAPSRKSQ